MDEAALNLLLRKSSRRFAKPETVKEIDTSGNEFARFQSLRK